MTLGRKLITFLILALGTLGLFWALNNASAPILISNARAIQVNDKTYAIYMDIENVGGPDIITKVVAKNATNVFIMGGSRDEGLAIPQGGKPSFSSDGAHIMLMLDNKDLVEGEFIPFSLQFKNAGSVAIKAIIKEPTTMSSAEMSSADQSGKLDHSMHQSGAIFEITNDQTRPEISMEILPNDDNSWLVNIQTNKFEFFEPLTEPLIHKDGQGHGHLYLNGLKLQRMYSDQATIGVLPTGKHTVSVTLNTNDHKAYSIDGSPVSSSVEITVK